MKRDCRGRSGLAMTDPAIVMAGLTTKIINPQYKIGGFRIFECPHHGGGG